MEPVMNWNFNYYIPTEVAFGCGKVAEVGKLVRRFGTRALLVSGPKDSRLQELYRKVLKLLEEEGIEAAYFDGVIPNPTTDVVSAGAKMAMDMGAQMVIGIGGGLEINLRLIGCRGICFYAFSGPLHISLGVQLNFRRYCIGRNAQQET